MGNQPVVNLEVERLRIEKRWREAEDEYVPLALAAATALHETLRGDSRDISAADYDDALNLTAVALWRLVSLYTLDEAQRRVAFRFDLRTDRFARSATEVRSRHGTTVAPLLVNRSEAVSAFHVIRQSGLPIDFRSDW